MRSQFMDSRTMKGYRIRTNRLTFTVDKSHEYLYKFKRSCRFYSGSHDPPGVSACNGWAADSGENSKKKYLCNLKL